MVIPERETVPTLATNGLTKLTRQPGRHDRSHRRLVLTSDRRDAAADVSEPRGSLGKRHVGVLRKLGVAFDEPPRQER